jgi:hypothetical protein
VTPVVPSDEDLQTVHTDEYLQSLRSSTTMARIMEMSVLAAIPGCLVHRLLLDKLRLQVGVGGEQGSVRGASHGVDADVWHCPGRSSGAGARCVHPHRRGLPPLQCTHFARPRILCSCGLAAARSGHVGVVLTPSRAGHYHVH